MTVILHSNLETDLRLAAALDANINMLLADMAGLRNSGALVDFGSVNGTGSDTKRVRYAGLAGTDAMSATAAENTAESTTALTDASADVAVVRLSLRRDISDLANLTGFAADVNPVALAESMVVSFERGFNGQVANVIDDFTTDVGTSGVDASIDDWFDGIYTLEIADNDSNDLWAIIHARQLADLQESARAESGAFQFMQEVASLIGAQSQGFVGSLLGVKTFVSSDVTSSGGNRHGAMFSRGAVGYATGSPSVIAAGTLVVRSEGPILVEIERTANAATTSVVGSGYSGAVLAEDARGVGFVTDA